ncbi:EamA family transporter [Aliarcobacter butzleri]|uniref:EamA family transporter n=1 Tax=Aliarcobacter butzleri TaxID=28197 RepID=UPI003AF8EDA6
MGYFYIFGTIFFTVYGQLILKWRISTIGISLPNEFLDKILFLFKLVFDPFIFSGFASAFIASFFWMAAMTKFELSYAYPFMSGAFVLVFILSVLLFNEVVTWQKILGLTFIVIGIFITSRSI